jgi:imidazolonepropionase-like amidohydrolase
MIQADLIIEGAAELLTLRGASNRPRRGEEMRDLGIIRQGALAARRGKIVWVGPTSDLLTSVRPMAFCKLIDAYGKTVMPGLVDPHTHLVPGARETNSAAHQGKTCLKMPRRRQDQRHGGRHQKASHQELSCRSIGSDRMLTLGHRRGGPSGYG